MKRFVIILSLLALLAVPAPRCHVEIERGRAWLVCPCRGVTYVCHDHWLIKNYQGRR